MGWFSGHDKYNLSSFIMDDGGVVGQKGMDENKIEESVASGQKNAPSSRDRDFTEKHDIMLEDEEEEKK